jgi:putative heme-binding domain-containing protein
VCHVSDGGGNARISLRHYEKIEKTKLVNEPPMHGTFGLSDARIIVPGDPFASVLFYRLSKLGRGRMPHVGSSLTDQKGLDVIHDWIVHLDHSQAKQVESNSPERAKNSAAVKALLKEELSADERNKAVHQLLSSTRGAFILSQLVAKKPLLPSAKQDLIALGMAHSDVNIRDLFERFIPESQRTKRLGETIDPGVILALTGNAEEGRRFFFAETASQCKNCHRIKNVGGTIGPDLSQIGKKYKRHELLESLIDSSKKIEEKYVTYVLVTKAGKVLTGILVEKTEKQIVLNVLKEGKGERVRVPTADVEELLPQKKSLMPDRLLRDLTPQQAADLLEFLASLK